MIFQFYLPNPSVYSHKHLDETIFPCYDSLPLVLGFPSVFIFSVFFEELTCFCNVTFDDRLDFLLAIGGRGTTLVIETFLTFLMTSASSVGVVVSGSTSTEVLLGAA